MVAIILSEKALLEIIVKAQVAAGYTTWKFIVEEGDYEHKGEGEFHCGEDGFHVLGVLLDTKGCKVVYGMSDPYCGNAIGDYEHYEWVMHEILDSWNCGKGNNSYQALSKAVSLLPK